MSLRRPRSSRTTRLLRVTMENTLMMTLNRKRWSMIGWLKRHKMRTWNRRDRYRTGRAGRAWI